MPAVELDSWRRIAGHLDTTLFVAVLGCYAEALGRLTGQHRFGVGVPVARRDTPVLQSAVNCLINSVCLPVDGALESDWQARLRSLHSVAVSAFAAQDVPFHEVVAAAEVPSGDRRPLYRAMFAYQDLVEPDLLLDGCTTAFTRLDPPQGASELLAEVFPRPGGSARIRLVHQPEKVSEAFARRLRDEFQQILHEAPARLTLAAP